MTNSTQINDAAALPVKVGVLGTASIARRRLLPALTQEARTVVAGIASREAGRADEPAAVYGCPAVTGYQALLDDPSVEAVYIPLPVALHAEWIEKALLAGKHVLAEKPLAADTFTTRRLFDLATSRSLVLHENFMFRHHEQHHAAQRLIRHGAIGEVRAFVGSFGIPSPPDGDIRWRADLGGGALLDVAAQPLMVALEYLGLDLQVKGATLKVDPISGVDAGGSILLAHPSTGVSAQILFGMERSYRASCEVWGSEGRILLDRAYAPSADHEATIVIDGSGRSDARTVRVEAQDQAAAAVGAFADAVRDPWHVNSPAPSLALARVLAETFVAAGHAFPPAVYGGSSRGRVEVADRHADSPEAIAMDLRGMPLPYPFCGLTPPR